MASATFRTQDPPVKKNAFVHKLYRMLNDASISHLIWWTGNPAGNTFSLSPGKEFAEALSNYFKHGNVASFVRQLHMYGFHKVTDPHLAAHVEHAPLIWEFRHSSGKFRRGDEASLVYIKRRPQTALQRESAAEQGAGAASAAKLPAAPFAAAPGTVPGSAVLPYYHQYPPLYLAGTTSQSQHHIQAPPPQIPLHVSHYANPHSAPNLHAPYSGYVYYAALPPPHHHQQNVPIYAPVLNSAPAPLGSENHGYFAPQAPYGYMQGPVLQPVTLPVNGGGYTLPSGFPQGYGGGYPVPQVQDLSWHPLLAYALGSPVDTPSELPAVATRPTPYIIKREQAASSPQSVPPQSPSVIQQAPISDPATPKPLLQREKPVDSSHTSPSSLDGRSLSESVLQFRKPFEPAVAHRNRIPSLLCDPLTNVCSTSHHHHQNPQHHASVPLTPLNGADAERRPPSWTSRSWASTLPSMDENAALANGRHSPRSMFTSRSSSSSILNPVTSPNSTFVQPESDSMRKAILAASTGRSITDRIRPSLVEIHAARPPHTTAGMKSMESISSHSSSIFSNHSSISSTSSGRFLSFGSISQSVPPTGFRCVSPLANSPDKDLRLVHLPSLSEHSSVETSEQETCFTPVALVGKPQDPPLNSQLPKVEFMLEAATDRRKRSKIDE